MYTPQCGFGAVRLNGPMRSFFMTIGLLFGSLNCGLSLHIRLYYLLCVVLHVNYTHIIPLMYLKVYGFGKIKGIKF